MFFYTRCYPVCLELCAALKRKNAYNLFSVYLIFSLKWIGAISSTLLIAFWIQMSSCHYRTKEWNNIGLQFFGLILQYDSQCCRQCNILHHYIYLHKRIYLIWKQSVCFLVYQINDIFSLVCIIRYVNLDISAAPQFTKDILTHIWPSTNISIQILHLLWFQ